LQPARLQRDQLEALAELIAFRRRQSREDGSRHERNQLVTARQAAQLLGVDLKTVYRHAKALGGRKVGGAWRFDLDATPVDPTEASARYASEKPQPSERAAAHGGRRSGTGARDRVRCHLLPVGRPSDRAG
jgi:plasmid replication initiation protein